MINTHKIRITVLFLFTLAISPAISTGYGYWDTLSETKNETVSTGHWDFMTNIGLQFAYDYETWIADQVAANPNSNFAYIYSQTDAPSDITMLVQDIDVFDMTWDFWGKAKTPVYPTLGYVSLIDRSLDASNNPVHDINPAYSTTPLYTDYSYFKAYDAMNTLTNNNYSLRLNYNTRMTSNGFVEITNVSFYAMLGLSDPDDPIGMKDNQKIFVEVKVSGGAWVKIGQPVPSQVSSTSEAFTYYSYDVPANLLGQDLKLRIRYNGRAQTINGTPGYGRLIIDELVVTVN